jgi:predicted unusual protein kinase regulating ubiquinone biosynthesis (AarF/ABC1/UbiB family)
MFKNMSLRKYMLYSSLTGLSAIAGYVNYQAPELKRSPYEFSQAILRGGRICVLGVKIASLYTFSQKNKSEKHTKAAEMMRDTFRKNQGLYIKFGQLLASLEILVPDEYCTVLR